MVGIASAVPLPVEFLSEGDSGWFPSQAVSEKRGNVKNKPVIVETYGPLLWSAPLKDVTARNTGRTTECRAIREGKISRLVPQS